MKLRWILATAVLMGVLFYLYRRHDYFDFKGSFYLTLEETDRMPLAKGWVARYISIDESDGCLDELVLQRGIVHSDASAYYTESAFLDLGARLSGGSCDTIESVGVHGGLVMCSLADRTGGYALTGIQVLPETLFAARWGTTDTTLFELKERLVVFPSEPPSLPWWYEHWLILHHE